MIKYFRNKEIDRRKWDECIQNSFNGIIYAYSWYLDIVCKQWDALIEDDYQRVFPLTLNKKFQISYLYQPFFTQQLGIFSRSLLTPEIIDDFLNAIPSKFKLIEINLNIFNKTSNQKFKIKENLTHELDLINPYENLLKEFSLNTKRNIKKAVDSGINIKKNVNPESIIDIFRDNRGKEIDTFKKSDYSNLKRLIYSCIFNDKASIWGAFNKQNVLCAGVFFVVSNKKVIFLFSATNQEAKETGAMSLLIDSFIRENAQRELTLDFEGSNDPNLARFYKSFGSKECTYLQVIWNEFPSFVKLGFRWYKKIKSF